MPDASSRPAGVLHGAGSRGPGRPCGGANRVPASARSHSAWGLTGGRAGFSNAHLIGAVAIFLVITLLLQVQSGALNLGNLTASKAPPAAASKAKPKAAKGIQMLPGAPATEPRPSRHDIMPKPLPLIPREEAIDAFARMGSEEAAAVLKALPPETAAEILAQLEERDIARILESAQPADAAQWVTLLLAMKTPVKLPEELLPPELAPGAGAEAAPAAGGNPAAPSGGTASGGAAATPAPGAAGQPPASGGATPPANPASPPAAGVNPAGGGGPAAPNPGGP